MRRTLHAFRSGDMPTLGGTFSDDVVWRVPGESFLAFHPEHLWDAFWG